VTVERSAVLGDGEFEWGYMARTPLRPEGVPLSAAAARFLTLLDGTRSIELAVAELVEGLTGEAAQGLARAALSVAQTFYVEGLVSQLESDGGSDG
jgi:hypothetical protein